jgi:hypothetical protein
MAEAWIRIVDASPPVSRVLHARVVDQPEPAAESHADDPAALILTCANCGAAMDERKCKLICSCGYFLSCSDYY